MCTWITISKPTNSCLVSQYVKYWGRLTDRFKNIHPNCKSVTKSTHCWRPVPQWCEYSMGLIIMWIWSVTRMPSLLSPFGLPKVCVHCWGSAEGAHYGEDIQSCKRKCVASAVRWPLTSLHGRALAGATQRGAGRFLGVQGLAHQCD